MVRDRGVQAYGLYDRLLSLRFIGDAAPVQDHEALYGAARGRRGGAPGQDEDASAVKAAGSRIRGPAAFFGNNACAVLSVKGAGAIQWEERNMEMSRRSCLRSALESRSRLSGSGALTGKNDEIHRFRCYRSGSFFDQGGVPAVQIRHPGLITEHHAVGLRGFIQENVKEWSG